MALSGTSPWGHAVIYTWEATRRFLQGQRLGETLGARCERCSRQAARHVDSGDANVDVDCVVIAIVVDEHAAADEFGCNVGDGGGVGARACGGDYDDVDDDDEDGDTDDQRSVGQSARHARA